MSGQTYGYHAGIPGQTDVRESDERSVLWFPAGGFAQHLFKTVRVDSTAVDSTNTPTSLLRPGLVVAELDSGDGWVDYDPDATDGSQQAAGILIEELYLLDPNSAAASDRAFRVLIGGPVIADECFGLDQQSRKQLRAQGVIFDDDLMKYGVTTYRRVVPKTEAYTLTASDNGTLFTTSGATGGVTFTLPDIAVGLQFEFLNLEDQDMTVASAEGDNMVVIDDAEADSIAFSTASEKVGARVLVESIYDGSTLRWVCENKSIGAHTVTPAT